MVSEEGCSLELQDLYCTAGAQRRGLGVCTRSSIERFSNLLQSGELLFFSTWIPVILDTDTANLYGTLHNITKCF